MRIKTALWLLLLALLTSSCSSQAEAETSACLFFRDQTVGANSSLNKILQLSRDAWDSEALVERLYEFDKYVYIAVSYPESIDKIKMASYDYEFDLLDEVLGKSQFFFPSIAKNVEIADPTNFKYEGNGIRASLLDTPDTQFNYFFTIKNCLVTRIEYQIEGGFDLKLSYKLDEEAQNILARANEEL